MKNKTLRIDLKASEADEKLLQKAAAKLGTNQVSKTIFGAVEQVANQPVEFHADRIAIRQTLENVEFGRVHLTNFIQEFFALIQQWPTKQDLQICLESVGSLGSHNLIQEAILEVVFKKLYDRMVLAHPDMVIDPSNVPEKDITGLMTEATKLNSIPEIRMHWTGILWDTYEISKEGEVTVIDAEVEKMNSAHRFYASTPEELQKLGMVNSLCESLNAFLKDKQVIPEKLFTVVYFDKELGRFAPSGSYVKFNLAPTANF
jgi:hypothetical protein